MAIKIQKGVPIPPKVTGRKSPIKDALLKMRVGDSILVEKQNGMRGRIWSMAVGLNMKFTTRTEGEKIRVWRVA